MKSRKRSQSRRKTPWDHLSDAEITPMQEYLRDLYRESYDTHHKSLLEMDDVKLFDSYKPCTCPYCQSDSFVRNGHYHTELRRYTCKSCGRSFCITTGTVFEDHKISVGEWMQYLLSLFDFVSLNADSRNNRNAFTTSRYWLEKVFLVLRDYQESTILKGDVYLDETYYSVACADAVRKDGKLLRGISRNKMCIGVAADSSCVYSRYEGNGKPAVTVKYGKTKLTYNTHYTVAFQSGRKNVGVYKVTVKLKGNYTGSKTVTFKINPKGTTLKSVSALSKGFTVTWNKQSAKMATSVITGYQIQIATDAKFTKGKKLITAAKYTTVSKKVTGLKAKTKYYVRIRTYKTVNKVKYYSPWSKAKYVTTK